MRSIPTSAVEKNEKRGRLCACARRERCFSMVTYMDGAGASDRPTGCKFLKAIDQTDSGIHA